YGIESVDHALHLATLLLHEGPLRVTDAAARLGVARSTAHRLLAMLVYRDFAEQDEDRRYVAGPVLRGAAAPEPVADLRRIALPHLEALAARTDESVNLAIVVGDQTRFIATVESTQVLRVGDREGRVLPAHLASGGRARVGARRRGGGGAGAGAAAPRRAPAPRPGGRRRRPPPRPRGAPAPPAAAAAGPGAPPRRPGGPGGGGRGAARRRPGAPGPR